MWRGGGEKDRRKEGGKEELKLKKKKSEIATGQENHVRRLTRPVYNYHKRHGGFNESHARISQHHTTL